MIWTICAAIALVFIASSIAVYCNKKIGSFCSVYALIGLVLATYTIYIPTYIGSYDTVSAMLANLVNIFHIAVVDGEMMAVYEMVFSGIGNPILSVGYMAIIGVLHLALPTVSAMTAVTVLIRCFSSMQMAFANLRKKPMFIFTQINERSLRLAKSLSNIKCDIVFAESLEESSAVDDGNHFKYVYKEESVLDLKLKAGKNKDIHLFCISDDENDSLSHTLGLIERFSKLPLEVQEHIHIYQFSKHKDYSIFLDSADKGALDLRCVNEYELLVYELLNQYPLYKSATDGINVLLYGLSDINVIALRTILWCGQLSGYPLKISVVGVDLSESVDHLKLTVPGLFDGRYSLNIYDCAGQKEAVDKIAEHCSDANYIMVAESTDNATMDCGIMLRRLFYRLDSQFKNCPPIFCYIKDPAKFNIVGSLATAESNPKRKMSYDLTPYGSLDGIYTYKNLIDSDLEDLAKNVHLAYEEIFSDGEIDVKQALSRYNIFEVNKRSNRANALHIRYKLNLLGLDYTDDPSAEGERLEDYLTDERLEQLAISEHDRWMAFLESEGWLQSTGQQVYAYRDSGISRGRHNCPVLKLHPYICEYDKLKELSVDLEGKDTTVYDRELIAKIPDIIGDKWGATGKRYKLIKLDK